MLIGLVKWFDADKGFGVVGTPDEEEYFLHINNFTTKPEKILKGTPIAFSPKTDKAKNRNSADNSRLVGIAEDWKAILSYLGKSDSVRIEVEVTGRGKRGNPYRHKEIQSFSLIGLSLKYFFQDKNEEEISSFITDYFDTDLDTKHFISYCELIENRLTKHFSNDISVNILNNVFSHFGNNLNEELLFTVWKQKKFKFISYNEIDDHEIPENILKAHILEIGKTELNRILKFSFGSEFGSYYVKNKFSNIENLTSTEIKELYQFVEFETETEREKRKQQLDRLYVQKIETELTEKANELGTIKNSDDFNNYNHLLQLIPYQFTNIDKNKITEVIHQIIAQKCSDEYKAELWVKGIIKDTSFELISKYFFDKDTQTEKRILILTKLDTEKQFELLKKYSDEFNFEKAFELLGSLLKKENSFDYYFNFSKVLYDSEFWKDKKGSELIELFTNYITTQSNDEQKYELFLKGYVKNVPQNIVRKNTHQLEKEDCKRIFKTISENKSFIKEILTEKVTLDNTSSLSWLYDLAIEFLDQENFNSFDKKVFDTIEQSEYFKLWVAGKAKVFPDNFILKNTHQLEKEDCKNIFKTMSENKSFIKEILTEKVTLDNTSSLSWLYDLAIEFLDQENFNSFDKKVFDTIDQSEYFKFWEIGKAKIFPESFIGEFLNEDWKNYKQIEFWLSEKIISKEKIEEFIFGYLKEEKPVTDRHIFYKQLNHIKYLLNIDDFAESENLRDYADDKPF